MTNAEHVGDVIEHLVRANHILSNEGVLDIFGHVSARDPIDPSLFLLSRSCSPLLVERRDICAFALDGTPVRDFGVRHYAERVIHACMYELREDVHAVCHLHANAILPFANTGADIVPVLHVGAVIGRRVPHWDSRDEFGDTNLLVSTLSEGRSLARALGPNWAVLMRRHGAVVVGRSIREVTFRAVHLCLNADVQLKAHALGRVSPLSKTEVDLAGDTNLQPSVLERAWDYWCARLAAGRAPPA